jgi:tetratricopeptide (TPR) repeat protein
LLKKLQTESITQLETLLKLQESTHGPGSIQAAEVLCRLARTYTECRQFEHAEQLYKRAMAIQNSTKHEAAATDTRKQLEILRATVKKLKEAGNVPSLTVSNDYFPAYVEPSASLVRPTIEMPIPTDAPPEYPAVHQRAAHNAALGVAIAQGLEEVAAKRQNEPESLALAKSLTKLADLYGRKKLIHEMEPLLLEALRIKEGIYGGEHLSVSTDLKNLARVYYFMERFEDADPLFKRSIAVRQTALDPLHPRVADIANWYAKTLRKLGRQADATAMEALVRESRAKYGADWEKFRQAGAKAIAEENYFVAQAMWTAALEEAKDFKADDPRLSATLENLAEVYWQQLKYDKAEPLCKRILQISETVLGLHHPDVSLAACNLALVCERQGKHIEASILYQQVLATQEKLLGPNHPDVVATRENHDRARRMAQKDVELKVDMAVAAGQWNKSGWWQSAD